ncbi:hypothetical protein GDO81_023262 [Engystomops pustulosus]|uniref:Uncharacterized protein n=1 Tax=Engystomops pustulosus TaxID=76066 RepID=A0AAV6YWI8_ENGPU|nr:hypothetical protein GDO81_023262 [Engystomops pustulosus]
MADHTASSPRSFMSYLIWYPYAAGYCISVCCVQALFFFYVCTYLFITFEMLFIFSFVFIEVSLVILHLQVYKDCLYIAFAYGITLCLW